MRISIINNLYAPFKIGGAEVSVQALAEGLVNHGNEVLVICLSDSKSREQELINGVSVVYLPLANIYWPYDGRKRSILKKVIWNLLDTYNFVMASRVKNVIEQFKPEVVHTNNLKGFSVAVWRSIKRSKIRLVHTSRDYYLFHPNSTMYSNESNQVVKSAEVFLASWLKKRESRLVDAYIGISKYVTNLHIDNGFFPNVESKTIFNMVEPVNSSKRASEKIVVGFMGTLSVAKGFDYFVKIARKFDAPRIKFVAAGNRATDNKSFNLYQDAIDADIELLGFVSPSDFLSRVDVVVIPVKWNEPFGRVVVEAALAKKLVLTTGRGGIGELAEIIPNVIILDETRFLDDLKYRYPVKSDENLWLENFASEAIVNSYYATFSEA